jgi:hypothetical protein
MNVEITHVESTISGYGAASNPIILIVFNKVNNFLIYRSKLNDSVTEYCEDIGDKIENNNVI